MTQKDFVNFPIKVDNDLHEALRNEAFRRRVSIHKLIKETLREKWLGNATVCEQESEDVQ